MNILILVTLLFSLSGCGYKANPFYTQDAPKGDENIEFKIKDK